MRKNVRKLSVEALSWVPTGTLGVFEKILNEDDITGARTVMLKSLPRPGDQLPDQRPQYHPVEEEFFCLSGRFTLEGDVWFEPGSYVYYPSNLVHGYAVDVPGGYEIYLRNSGPLSTKRVDSPAKNKLHFIHKESEPASGVILCHTRERLDSMLNEKTISVLSLRDTQDGDEGAMVVTLPHNTHVTSPADGFDGFLEIYVIDGKIEIANHAVLSSHDYACLPPQTPVELIGLEAMSKCLVNYSGQYIFSCFERAASEVTKLPDL